MTGTTGVTGALVLLLGTAIGPAHADSTLPLHTQVRDVRLLGASSTGVAVLQDGASTADPDVVHTGLWGLDLTARPQMPTTEGFRQQYLTGDVSGDVLAWGMAFHGSNSSSSTLYRTDLATGSTTLDGRTSGVSFRLAGNSWLTRPDPFATLPFGSEGLQLLPLATAPGDAVAGWPGESEFFTPPATAALAGWDSDATSAAVVTRAYGKDDNPFSPTGNLQVQVQPLAGGLPQPLATTDGADVTDLALGTGTIAWSTQDSSGVRRVSTAARTGGTPVSHVEADPKADLDHLAVRDDGTVGYLVPTGTGTVLRTVSGSAVRDVSLPTGSAGLDAVGGDFVTATGRGDSPGVYRIGADGTPVLAARVQAPENPVGSWDLDAGKLYYADRAKGSGRTLALWARSIGTGAELGDEISMASPAGGVPQERNALPIAFSGARGIVGSPKYNLQWDLLDRDRHTVSIEETPVKTRRGTVVVAAEPQVSGAYALLGGQIHRTDGELLGSLPAAARVAGRQSLFGPKVLYGTTAGRRGQVWLLDAEKRKAVMLFEQTCDHAPPVALWGRTATWLNCGATRLAVRDLVTGAIRSVATGIVPTTEPADIELSIGEGSLAWVAAGDAAVLDLSAGDSTPVHLPGTTRSLALDRGLVARSLERENPYEPMDLMVSDLPFEVTSHPRLTGSVRLLGFSPDGDGVRDTWAPAFDTTEPLAWATLTITSERTGRTVQKITTKDTADGAVRDLIWDGFTSSGLGAARGYYRWTLTAASPSGAALTTATDGATISGRIELSS
ncbi:hypothetical protein [Kineosporia sp. NBRC 101731]|uniref:hypothetical protein n=1 Tax=Kineosporia sp. NBRC 101731 TaxID=3032199 RepID=UPI0024A5E0FC|nr:hypothetical protein [Kineosporia sp. NBRC 101731]GLY33327.1 hypothetical protein Kisp02_66920 [Kineosporia sp. NBRC 101731]